MLVPISWLKEYTKINLPLKKLMWRMTEAGMTTESYKKVDGEVILDVEVTPNRPDWLSMVGIAREVSLIENSNLKLPKLPDIKKTSANLPIKVNVDKNLVGRYSGVTIAKVSVKPSPKWLQKRLKFIGLRPINNLVDITNYVMSEFGIPTHIFDYDKFLTNKLTVELSKGGEKFTSVDGISYTLPKNALIIKDKDRVIDLAAIKGGENTGITNSTKNIFIHIPIYDPITTRKTSNTMKLASDASYIYERGPDLGGTINTLKRTVDLILKLAGGKVASEIIDIKRKDYLPRKLTLNLPKLVKVLGIKIDNKKVLKILKKLELDPKLESKKINCQIPTFRNDIQIEEDIIEEVARIWGYNKFPKTLPVSNISTQKIPFFYDPTLHNKLKHLLIAVGYMEVQTYALTSKKAIDKAQLQEDAHIKIDNPVSSEYEYMRTSLIPNLLISIKSNAQEDVLKLFEVNRIYLGVIGKSEELYQLSGIEKNTGFESLKGTIDLILSRLGISKQEIKSSNVTSGMWHPVKGGVIEKGNKIIGYFGHLHPKVLQNYDIKDKVFAFELDVKTLEGLARKKTFKSPPKYPAQIEDITLQLPKRIKLGDIISTIKSASKLISEVELVDTYKDSYTFRIHYQHPKKTLKDNEVKKIRSKITKTLKKKYGTRSQF
jgi:phenylalanyl-tRNA synthetase beta chain